MNQCAVHGCREPLSDLFSPREWGRIFDGLTLSPQQQRIVSLLLQGMGDKQIAEHLGIAFPTVRTYLARIFAHLGVADRAELVLRVFRVSPRLSGLPPSSALMTAQMAACQPPNKSG